MIFKILIIIGELGYLCYEGFVWFEVWCDLRIIGLVFLSLVVYDFYMLEEFFGFLFVLYIVIWRSKKENCSESWKVVSLWCVVMLRKRWFLVEMCFWRKLRAYRNIWVFTNLIYEIFCFFFLKCRVIKIFGSYFEFFYLMVEFFDIFVGWVLFVYF